MISKTYKITTLSILGYITLHNVLAIYITLPKMHWDFEIIQNRDIERCI